MSTTPSTARIAQTTIRGVFEPVTCVSNYKLVVNIHESSSLAWMGPNQHLPAPQTHNPFFPSDYCHLASLTLVQLGIHQS